MHRLSSTIQAACAGLGNGLRALAAGACLGSSTLLAGLSGDSPFMPPPSGPQAAADQSGDIQLSGISRIDSKLAVCLVEVATKRSRWIIVGGNSEGIEVLSCDYDAGRASIRVRGEQRDLSLRKATIAKGRFEHPVSQTATPAAQAQAQQPPSAPVDPSQIPPPTTREEKEREARMMVSDMLEMSMRQRRAYEEAKRKADEEKKREGAAKAPAPSPSP